MSDLSRNEVDAVWQSLVDVVMDEFHEWKQKASAATGLPFSRIRALWRLESRTMSLRELSEALLVDAPATTVIVNNLVKIGLAERYPDPDNGRVKIVRLTEKGRSVLKEVEHLHHPAPAALAELTFDDFAQFRRIVDQIVHAKDRT